MYRNWLDNKQVRIQLSAFNYEAPEDVEGMNALPNDPGYLMAHTSCPDPFADTPMFAPWGGEDSTREYPVEFRGQTYPVTVRYSLAKPEARYGDNQGSTERGRHAKNNVGVSIVRAGRELELDQSLVNAYDPRERWWGVEVDFPPALDDLFGVTNNKQSARNFTDLAKQDTEVLTKGRTLNALLRDFKENDDPRGALLTIINDISNAIKRMRDELQTQKAGQRRLSKEPVDDEAAEEDATARTIKRQAEGHAGQSDLDESLPDDTKRENIRQAVYDLGLPETFAETLVARIVSDNLKYQFISADLGSAAFFQVKNRGTGSIVIALNTGHPVYDSLIEVLQESTANVGIDELRARLESARDGLKTLLIAWARYEDELPEGKLRQAAQNARDDWGRVARDFLVGEE